MDTALHEFQSDALTHLPSLLATARRLARSENEAEDLVQDTFVKALRARDQYQPGTNLRAWLHKILRNAFINRYHRGTLERSVLGASVPDPVADGWLSTASMNSMRNPEAASLRPELERALTAAIDKLPPEFRQVVVLADVEEFTYKEIGEIIGCPIGTVMSRLHRARRALKQELVQEARDLGLVRAEDEIGVGDAESTVSLGQFRRRREHQEQAKQESGAGVGYRGGEK